MDGKRGGVTGGCDGGEGMRITEFGYLSHSSRQT